MTTIELERGIEGLNAEDKRRAHLILSRARSTNFEPERAACYAAIERIIERYSFDPFTSAVNQISDDQFDMVLLALDYLGVYMSDLADDYIWIEKGGKDHLFSSFDKARQFHCFNWAMKQWKKINEEPDYFKIGKIAYFKQYEEHFNWMDMGDFDDDGAYYSLPMWTKEEFEQAGKEIFPEIYKDAALKVAYTFKLYYDKTVKNGV